MTRKWNKVGFAAVVLLAEMLMPPAMRPGRAQTMLIREGSLTASASTCTTAVCVQMPVNSSVGSVAVQVAGTFSATISFEGALDGTNWTAAMAVPLAPPGNPVNSTTSAGLWQIGGWGYTGVRARVSSYTSGTAAVTMAQSTVRVPFPYTITLPTQLTEAGVNGQSVAINNVTEVTTIAAAATTATAIQIPANSIVLGAAVRVTTAIPTASSFTVTGTTSSTVFNTAAVSAAANSTDVGTHACPYLNGAAQTITYAPNQTPATNAGRVRITIYYIEVTPPTS